VVVYALGGGRGHGARGGGLAAALEGRGVATRLLVPERLVGMCQRLAPRAEIVGLARPASPRALAAALPLEDAAALVVDTFPEGLLEELASVRLPRFGLLRLRRDVGGTRFLRGLEACEAAVDLEPQLEWIDDARVTPLSPVARSVVSPGECDGSVCLLGGQDAALERLMSRLGQRLAACGVPVRRHLGGDEPLWFSRRPRVVVGAAGYNLTYELARAGIHHLAIVRPRPFDEQARRARAMAFCPNSPEALERAILERVLDSEPRQASAVVGHEALAAWLLERPPSGA
jgi:hypothetical protein